MTDATILRNMTGHGAHGGFASPVRIARPLRRLLKFFKPAIRASAAEDLGRRIGASVASPVLVREVVTIDSFARYLAIHPDMPLEHRERFLDQIRRSCDEIRSELI